ncbi:hypothetical protein GCM10020001_104270 [Nonomuraea salmonea]
MRTVPKADIRSQDDGGSVGTQVYGVHETSDTGAGDLGSRQTQTIMEGLGFTFRDRFRDVGDNPRSSQDRGGDGFEGAQRPVAGGIQFGQFGIDLEADGTEEVDGSLRAGEMWAGASSLA